MPAKGIEDFLQVDVSIYGSGYVAVHDEATGDLMGVVKPGGIPPVGMLIRFHDEHNFNKAPSGWYMVTHVVYEATLRAPDDQMTAFAEAEASRTPVPPLPGFLSIYVTPAQLDTSP